MVWRHSSSRSPPVSEALSKTGDPIVAAARDPLASHDPIKPESGKALWSRPAPAVAARNSRRCGFGANLAPIGASPGIIERFSNGDIAGAGW
jgi:hypothetical protein